jgi:hypothetical protein
VQAPDGITVRFGSRPGAADMRDVEEIGRVWDGLRARHASLDVERALDLYVPEVADYLRTRLAEVDVHDGSCGIALANVKALRGPLSTLDLRSLEFDESGHFATAEASDDVRRVTFHMTRYRFRSTIGGADERRDFRWAFEAKAIQVR